MKKLLSLVLIMALCIPFVGVSGLISTNAAAASSHIYTIVTNPGQDMNTQMNVSFHADYTYTGCYVEYTTANDTSFASAKKVTGSYNDQDYMWFYNRYTTSSTSSARFTTKFLNYNVDLNGLTPDTDYIYRICDGAGAYSETYAFKTAGQSEFSIICTSDMHMEHNNSTKYTKYVNALNYSENNTKYELGLHINTGDLVASGDRYKYWQKIYEPSIFKRIPFASTVGNHDVYDNMMDDDSNYTDFWKTGKYFGVAANYPDNAYTQTSDRINGYLSNNGYSSYKSNSSDILFDPGTGTLAGKYITGANENLNGRTYWFLYNRILFISFDYYSLAVSSAEIANAFNWAYDVIDANKGKYDYLIAFQHITIVEGGSGTSYRNGYEKWQPFLDTANVDIFLFGDNHMYVRTNKMLNGQVTTDPEKGTYLLQCPAITNTDSYGNNSGAVGWAVDRYSAPNYFGTFIIDVDSEGMHFKVAVATGTSSSMSIYDEFTIPKKVRYSDTTTGYYTAKSALTVKESADSASQSLTTIPAGTVIEVTEGNGVFGRVRYNGYTGWVNLSGYTNEYYTTNVKTPEQFVISNVNVGFSSAHLVDAYTPTYGSTIANGGWTFAGQVTITAVRDSNNAYKVTAQDTSGDAKSGTAIPSNGCVLLISKNYANYASLMSALAVGNYFTLDTKRITIYTANPGESNATVVIPGNEPEELVIADGSSYSRDTYITGAATATSVESFVAEFVNSALKVYDRSGTELESGDIVATGYTVKCFNASGVEVDSCVIVVASDVNGDAICSSSDCLAVENAINGSSELNGAYSAAGDLTGDGTVNTTDYAVFVAILLG